MSDFSPNNIKVDPGSFGQQARALDNALRDFRLRTNAFSHDADTLLSGMNSNFNDTLVKVLKRFEFDQGNSVIAEIKAYQQKMDLLSTQFAKEDNSLAAAILKGAEDGFRSLPH